MSALATEAVEAPTESIPAGNPAAVDEGTPVPEGAAQKCPTACPCSAQEGHRFGGMPAVVTVTVSVAGLPPMDVAELHTEVGAVVAGPNLRAGDGSKEHPYTGVESIRSIDLVAPTYGEIYRATAEKLAEAIPGLHEMAAQADAADAAEVEVLAAGDDEATTEAAPVDGDTEPVPTCGDAPRAEAAAGCCKGGGLVEVEGPNGSSAP